jgi:hypothetical protein
MRTIRVHASTDDAEEFLTDGTVNLDSPDLDLPTDADMIPRLVGMRFLDVPIPPLSDILSATVQFTAAADGSGPVSLVVVGEAAGNALTFSAVPNNLTTRTFTGSSVAWNPPDWTGGAAQLTPELEEVVQEIVDGPGWAKGNDLALFIGGTGGAGARSAVSYDGAPFSAPVLEINYEEPSSPLVGPFPLPVCVPPQSNPNTGGSTQLDPMLDCAGRVQPTVQGISDACPGYPARCTCIPEVDSLRFSDVCDADCVEDQVESDCSDFDPVAGNVSATNAMGGQKICLANSPLASALYGRRTTCAVSGTAHVEIEGESADPSAAGILQFLGDPCPGQSCAVGMEYRLDIGSVTFGNVFGSATFADLAGLGESLADAVLSSAGAGTFGADECALSARGVRDGDQRALVATNNDVINVNVNWGSMAPTCALNGSLVGSADPELKRCESAGPDADKVCADDSECTDDAGCSDGDCNCESVGSSELLVGLNVAGDILNQPPTADAGLDQTVECPAPGVLDASASSDLDSNIALFSWLRGSRSGGEVGFEEVSTVEQGLGTQNYVLRVIDAFGQADEDTTAVTVVDTTPPLLSCAVAVPVLDKNRHTMANVGLTGRARDACEGELPVMVSVFGDEDDESPTGDGTFSPDGQEIALETLRLRQERQGNGDGRVYLTLVEATDSSGNRGINCCTVVVPHSNKQAALQSVQGQAAAAQAFCLANEGMAPAGYFAIGDGPVIGPKQ